MDKRAQPVFKASEKTISVDPATVTIPTEGGSQEVTVTASGEYEISSLSGFNVEQTDKGVKISSGANSSGKDKKATLTLTLNADRSKTATVSISQSKGA